MLHCDLRVRWKVASDLRFRAAISEPKTPSFCGISGDLARQRENTTTKARISYACRTPKILGKEAKNAQNHKESLEKEKGKEILKSKEKKIRVLISVNAEGGHSFTDSEWHASLEHCPALLAFTPSVEAC